MKNVLIIGASRTGKTTLATIICQKYNYQYISGDSIRNSLIKIFPETNITIKMATKDKRLCEYIKHLTQENNFHLKGNLNYVIDSTNITINNALKYFNKYLIIVLGCTKLNKDEYLKNIRNNDTEKDWTFYHDDEYLLLECEHSIEKSKKLKKECIKKNIKYFEMSHNREEKLYEILNYIEEKIGDN